eukprot:6034760-Prymnesium_polylepis.2
MPAGRRVDARLILLREEGRVLVGRARLVRRRPEDVLEGGDAHHPVLQAAEANVPRVGAQRIVGRRAGARHPGDLERLQQIARHRQRILDGRRYARGGRSHAAQPRGRRAEGGGPIVRLAILADKVVLKRRHARAARGSCLKQSKVEVFRRVRPRQHVGAVAARLIGPRAEGARWRVRHAAVPGDAVAHEGRARRRVDIVAAKVGHVQHHGHLERAESAGEPVGPRPPVGDARDGAFEDLANVKPVVELHVADAHARAGERVQRRAEQHVRCLIRAVPRVPAAAGLQVARPLVEVVVGAIVCPVAERAQRHVRRDRRGPVGAVVAAQRGAMGLDCGRRPGGGREDGRVREVSGQRREFG